MPARLCFVSRGALLLAASLTILRPAAQNHAQKQESEEGQRQLWNSEFSAARPVPATPGKTLRKPVPPSAGHVMVGVTVWLLRPSRPEDDASIRISSPEANWTPVRVEVGAPLQAGQRVRVGIESARSGYLYVIDREQYADGSVGRPYLIFPLSRLRAGDNKVTAGRMIEIPGLDDNPRFLTLRPSREDQTAELLTALVTPAPLAEIKIGRDPVPLDPAQVERWSKQFSSKVQRLEARHQLGQPYTKAEQEAASNTRLLTYGEPLPQTMYRVEAKPGDSVLIQVPLRIGK